MGSGFAFLDYDNDGDQDLFLVNGRSWPGHPTGRRATQALFQNDGKGHFRDVTRQAGLDLEYYGMGVAVGDVNNDGAVDLYLTGLGRNHLFLNRGDGTFSDATISSGLGGSGWGTSAAFLDYDRDGDLDLFVCNYVKWTPQTDLFCTLDGKHKSYCTPESYQGEPDRLYRNDGQGRFTDVSEAAGILKGKGKSLRVAVLDYNEDGWVDIAVANDTQPNLLFKNLGNGTFQEVGVETGMAYGESGVARGAMGIDAADYLNRGSDSLLIGNFSNQMLALYHNAGEVFIDKAPSSTLGQASLLFLAFGLFSSTTTWTATSISWWPMDTWRTTSRRCRNRSPTRNDRCCSKTSETGISRRWEPEAAKGSQSRWWDVAPPTRMSTATAIWTR